MQTIGHAARVLRDAGYLVIEGENHVSAINDRDPDHAVLLFAVAHPLQYEFRDADLARLPMHEGVGLAALITTLRSLGHLPEEPTVRHIA